MRMTKKRRESVVTVRVPAMWRAVMDYYRDSWLPDDDRMSSKLQISTIVRRGVLRELAASGFLQELGPEGFYRYLPRLRALSAWTDPVKELGIVFTDDDEEQDEDDCLGQVAE